jgi:rhodanese-related sulfurtransferase
MLILIYRCGCARPNAFGKGHVKGAINTPHREMTATRMAEYPKDKVFVVYYARPHCNGANKAALRLARLGLPVKMMIGGVTGWRFDQTRSVAVAGASDGLAHGLVDFGGIHPPRH